MATNHTENYQLNLWEPEDAFLRTEFNENFQKIDGALWLEKLLSLEPTEEVPNLTLSLADRDMSRYAALILLGRLTTSSLNLQLNDRTDQLYKAYRQMNNTSNFTDGPLSQAPLGNGAACGGGFVSWLLPGGNGVCVLTHQFYAYSADPYTSHAQGVFSGVEWNTLEKLRFSGTLFPGNTLTVYALRR